MMCPHVIRVHHHFTEDAIMNMNAIKEHLWNPWHGCKKYSEGCVNCYVYRRDALFGRDSTRVARTGEFDLPLRKKRDGSFKIPSGSEIFACMTSDFFIDSADEWRGEAWNMMYTRKDVNFNIITKRVVRIRKCLPENWGNGWENVSIGATVENRRRAEERLGEFLELPIRHKFLVCEPLLEQLDLDIWLKTGKIERVIVGGESGANARPLDYDWVLALREQCLRTGTGFRFKQTGAHFIKNGKLYNIERMLQMPQAKRAGIDVSPADGNK